MITKFQKDKKSNTTITKNLKKSDTKHYSKYMDNYFDTLCKKIEKTEYPLSSPGYCLAPHSHISDL